MTGGEDFDEVFVCPCWGSLSVPIWVDGEPYLECTECPTYAPLWYLRLMGIHECERDEYVDAFERATSIPVDFMGRRYGDVFVP